MSFSKFMKSLNGEGVEGELIKTVFFSLVTSFLFLGILYYTKFQYIENFTSKFSIYLFFSALSYAIVLPAIYQIRAYKELPCMSGMMVGMTTGMVAGFLLGFYVAATNGMFIGGFFGVALGIALGIWNGKCCGIMGVMEGVMAGFMGGLMGAMTAFMLFNDNIQIAAVLVFIISAIIVLSLNYMIYKETREVKRQKAKDNFFTIALTFILMALTTWLIVYGPRSAIFS